MKLFYILTISLLFSSCKEKEMPIVEPPVIKYMPILNYDNYLGCGFNTSYVFGAHQFSNRKEYLKFENLPIANNRIDTIELSNSDIDCSIIFYKSESTICNIDNDVPIIDKWNCTSGTLILQDSISTFYSGALDDTITQLFIRFNFKNGCFVNGDNNIVLDSLSSEYFEIVELLW